MAWVVLETTAKSLIISSETTICLFLSFTRKDPPMDIKLKRKMGMISPDSYYCKAYTIPNSHNKITFLIFKKNFTGILKQSFTQ